MSSSEIETVVFNLYLTRAFQCAATALIAHDYLLTLDREIAFFWYTPTGRWTLARYLFFLNRYFPLFAISLNTWALLSTEITEHFCYVWVHFLVISFGAVEIFVIQLILITRIYAMYSRNKTLLWVLCILFVLCAAAAVTTAAIAVSGSPSTNEPLPGVIICASLIPPKNIWSFWIPILVFESILFLLAVNKSIRHVYKNPLGETLTTNFLRIILRDSVVYYFAILVAYMINALIWRFGAPSLLDVFHGMALSFVSMAGGRMLMNLRERGEIEEKTQWRRTVGQRSAGSNIIFIREEVSVANI
ncbi:hypothetical protein C8R47DRAFT_1138733 [Mycena vitilis]|nr:hypothetical protein C8R47DRAFT_1138733 [Mycena vitilis]